MTSEPSIFPTVATPNNHGTWEEAVLTLRRQPNQQQLVLDAYYDDPLTNSAARYYASEEWADIRRWLGQKGGSAIDIGAGRGIASYALAMDGFVVSALEPDTSAIVGGEAIEGLAADTKLPITVVRATAEDIPVSDESFDVVFARAALHHTSDLKTACSEFFRVLRPGGRPIAVREHVISRQGDLSRFFEIHPLHRYYGGENAYLLKVYLAAMRDAGFVVKQVRGPLESAMNTAPQTRASLCDAIANRTGPLRSLAKTVLSAPGVWAALMPIVARIDHRPGRLFSFLARKPQ